MHGIEIRMAFSWEISPASSGSANADLLLTRLRVISFSQKINVLASDIKQLGNLLLEAEKPPYTKADYDNLAASLEKLARSFETLQRYGDSGDGTAPQSGVDEGVLPS